MRDASTPARASSARLVLAFGSVYLIWGSTFLAIRYAIETLPPLLMAGGRFIIAGGILYTWGRVRGASPPERANWGKALAIGALLLLGGNGMVVLAERRVPSGLAALLIATEPMLIVLLDWARPGGIRPTARVAVGVALGLIGMIVLVGPNGLGGGAPVDLVGAGLLMVATTSWAAGSVYAARVRLSDSPVMASSMQMLGGGLLLFAIGLCAGEAATFNPGAVSVRSAGAVGYLILFGSLVGFSSYSWLLKAAPMSLVSTYAYVNPIVAVILGWAIAGEPLTPRTLSAAAIIIVAVITVTYSARAAKVKPALAGADEALAMRKPLADGFTQAGCAEASD